MTTAKRTAEYIRSLHWKLYAFQVTRVPGKGAQSEPVEPRRVVVYAPSAEAARLGAGVSKDENARVVMARPWEWFGCTKRPKQQEISDFYETMGSALGTGAGLTHALDMAARIATSRMMRGIIGTLHESVTQGVDLHEAMAGFPRVFTPMQLAMVKAANETGLDKAGGLLTTMALRLQKQGKIWRKLLGALAYPLSIFVLTLVGTVVLEIWALPPMVELFKTLGGTLPPVTKAFYEVAKFVKGNALLVFPGIFLVCASIVSGAPVVMRMRWFQRFAVKAPYVGPVVQWMALSRAIGTFGLLKQSGAAVRDQFMLAAQAAGNCVVADFFEACYRRIAFGETVEEAFTAERHRLREDGIRMAGKMEVVMAGGSLEQLLNGLIGDFDDRADTRLTIMPNLIRWPLMTVCCFMIGVVALAIVLPYPSLIADVAQQQVAASK